MRYWTYIRYPISPIYIGLNGSVPAKEMKMESMKRKLYFPDRRPGLLLIRLHHQEGEERKPVTLTRYVYFPVMSSLDKKRGLPCFPFWGEESQFWLLSTHQKRMKIVEVIHIVPKAAKKVWNFIYWNFNNLSIIHFSLYQSLNFCAKEHRTF